MSTLCSDGLGWDALEMGALFPGDAIMFSNELWREVCSAASSLAWATMVNSQSSIKESCLFRHPRGRWRVRPRPRSSPQLPTITSHPFILGTDIVAVLGMLMLLDVLAWLQLMVCLEMMI